ncbi:AlpA family phage regulatory protein [Escherichia coli]
MSLGVNSVGWLETEINEWIEMRITARDKMRA